MLTQEIRSINDLLSEIKSIITTTNHRLLFRGHSNESWDLLPSVKRKCTDIEERYLTNEFKVKAPSRYSHCPPVDDYSSWLALMQHFGLPTRLLDWSYSPLVALYFAVSANNESNIPCIWALSARTLNQSQGFDPVVYPINAWSFEELILPAFKKRPESNKVGVAMGIEFDSRIQLQQGAFTIHSTNIPLNNFENASEFLYKFIIPRECKEELYKELQILGISKSYLFPDLASLSEDLKSKYRII